MIRAEDKPFYDLNPAEAVATTSDAEARGEGEDGEIAVMWVLKNRTIFGHWYLDTDILNSGLSAYHAVAFKNGIPKGGTIPVYQFSCLKDGTPDRKHMISIVTDPAKLKLMLIDTAWAVINGKISDPTKGASYYYNPDLCSPTWAKIFKETAIINHHRFMKP